MKNLDYGKNYLTNKEIEKRSEIASEYTIKCSCGKSVTLTNKYGRVICSWCGNWVYRDEKTKFRYKLLERLENGKRKDMV